MNTNLVMILTVAVVLTGAFVLNVEPTIMAAGSLTAMVVLVHAIGRFFTQRTEVPSLAPAVYNRDQRP